MRLSSLDKRVAVGGLCSIAMTPLEVTEGRKKTGKKSNGLCIMRVQFVTTSQRPKEQNIKEALKKRKGGKRKHDQVSCQIVCCLVVHLVNLSFLFICSLLSEEGQERRERRNGGESLRLAGNRITIDHDCKGIESVGCNCSRLEFVPFFLVDWENTNPLCRRLVE